MPAPSRPDQLVDVTFSSEVLRANPLGDPATRRFPVYLPPQYQTDTDRRFAVAWLLAGYTGWGEMKARNPKPWTESLPDRLDRLMQLPADDPDHIAPMIVAFPDCFTRFGGSQYRNSPVTGRYEDYFIDELVPAIDGRFRTIADRDHRAVFGKSSGGYGAMLHAMRHPDVFGLMCSTAGDCYFPMCCPGDLGKAFQRFRAHGGPAAFVDYFFSTEKRKSDDFAAMMIIAYGQAYSPNPAVPGYFADLPVDLETGEIVDAVWQRWLACDPVNMVEGHAAALRSMRLIFLDAGTSDEWYLDVGQRVFASRLRAKGIAYDFEEFEGGHLGIDFRIDASLRRIGAALPA